MTLNEDLALMGSLLQKMRVELFHLQHIQVDQSTKNRSDILKLEIQKLAIDLHYFAQTVEEQIVNMPSTIKPMEIQAPLRTSSDSLTRLRKFNGNESEDDKIDFFEH